MENLTEILMAATANIANTYFYLNVAGGPSIFRERVYCYELYHQLRLRWNDSSAYVLNGEIDKRAHPILQELGADYPKPDFLVHSPGNMNSNYAIIEVKHSLDANGIRKDLATLDLFLRRAQYMRAIYLFYGLYEETDVNERVRALAAELEELMPIEIWLHDRVQRPARQIDSIHRARIL
jgi:hypothetical protein